MIGCFESFGQRFRDPGEVRDNRPIAVGRAALEKRGQVVAEPAQTRMPRRNSVDIGACQRVEGGVAKVGRKDAVPAAYRFEKTQQIGLAIDVDENAARFARAIEDLGENAVVAGDNGVLKRGLDGRQILHGQRRAGSLRTPRATFRLRSTSATISPSDEASSSRSIMVETGPKRRSAAAYRSQTSSLTGWSCVSTR